MLNPTHLHHAHEAKQDVKQQTPLPTKEESDPHGGTLDLIQKLQRILEDAGHRDLVKEFTEIGTCAGRDIWLEAVGTFGFKGIENPLDIINKLVIVVAHFQPVPLKMNLALS